MDLNLENVLFIRLNHEHEIKDFDCSDADLNDFLLNESKNYLQQLLAVTYILESDEDTVAFFSLSNDKVSVEELESNNQYKKFRLKLFSSRKQLRSYPAVKIGRLGVSSKYQGKGVGKLILDYIKDSFSNNNKTGCRFITVDAYKQSLKFYEKTGFVYLTNNDVQRDTRLMYFDLNTLTIEI